MRAVTAVAAAFLREQLRRRGAPLALLGLLGLCILLPRAGRADARLLPRLQLQVSYGVGLPVFVLSLAVVILAARSVARLRETERLPLLVTKPLRSWQLLAGSLLGVSCVALLALTLVFGSFLVNAALLQWTSSGTPEERAEASRGFWTASRGVPARERPVEGEVEEALWREAAARGPEERERMTDTEFVVRGRRMLRTRRLEPGEQAVFEFSGSELPASSPPTSEGASALRLRYQLRLAEPGRVRCAWRAVLDEAGEEPAGPWIEQLSVPGVPAELAIAWQRRPAGGVFRVALKNPADTDLALLAEPGRIELLLPGGGLVPNALRALLVLLCELALLAALAVVAGSVFSSSTAVLVGLFAYGSALSADFLRAAVASVLAHPGPAHAHRHAASRGLLEALTEHAAGIADLALSWLPGLSRIQPLDSLVQGRLLPAGLVLEEAARLVALEAALLILVGAWIHSRREALSGPGGAG